MPKMATKAADNVFYKARIAAASWNDRLGSREGASEVTGIDRTRLANIELGTINPHPEEVLMLSDTYNAPELQNHFCSHLCPLGIGTISPIELEELERVTLQLISAMKSLRSTDMPRMSKSKKLEWSFFLNDRGRKAYNTLCRRCVHDCKQSFRAVVVICPHYRSKRAKKGGTSAYSPRGPDGTPP